MKNEAILKELNDMTNRIEEFKKQIEKPEFEVGKWYKSEENKKCHSTLFYCTRINEDRMYGYGFVNSEWENDSSIWIADKENNCIEATPTEVQEALEKEAVKRGFKEGEKVTAILGKGKIKTTWILGKLTYRKCLSEWIFGDGNYCIFNYGVWAEIQKTMSTLDYVKEFYETSSINLANRNELIAYIKNNNLQIIETLNNL